MGNPQSSDTVILEEKDRRFSVSICKSSDERFLIIQFLGKRCSFCGGTWPEVIPLSLQLTACLSLNPFVFLVTLAFVLLKGLMI